MRVLNVCFVLKMNPLIISLLHALIFLVFENGTFFNIFSFKGNTIEDLWDLDCVIPLKKQYVVELIRGQYY
jgi:hypothetical protein